MPSQVNSGNRYSLLVELISKTSTVLVQVHGYSTLGEMVRRLDFARAAEISYRFPYILEITDLLVRRKMNTLSATAQGHLFLLIQALLIQGKVNGYVVIICRKKAGR